MKYSIFLLILISEINSHLIVLPFIIKDIPQKENHHFIYTNIEIGEPPRKIDSIINFSNSLFYFSSTNFLNKNINLTTAYDSSLSNTFKLLWGINMTSLPSELINIISEVFYFYTDINCESKHKYILSNILYPDINNKESLFPIIDLQINSSNKPFNFISILKTLNIIDNYYWTIQFQNLSTGKIIIGDLPHNYEKEKYKDKELKLINTYSKENKIFWGIQFSAIKFDKITMTDIMIGKIDLKNLEIFGSYEYILKIEEIFFDKYKENYICSRTFDEVDGEDVFRFICDKNLFNKNDINLFPNLTLINVELNFSFIFTGNDLFIEKNDKIYFMIVSKVGRTQGEWNLGRIFLYKYQFIMDYDNKLIGIYKESERKIEEKIKEKNKNKYKFAILIIIIVLLVIFIVVLIIFAFIKKGFWKNRKKRISELDDGFLYITKENETQKEIN